MIPSAYLEYMAGMGVEVEAPPEPKPTVPPDPTKRDLGPWGSAYPCLRYPNQPNSRQCGGMMQPAPRCKRYDGELWRRFTCDRCGRVAHDTKEEPCERPSKPST